MSDALHHSRNCIVSDLAQIIQCAAQAIHIGRHRCIIAGNGALHGIDLAVQIAHRILILLLQRLDIAPGVRGYAAHRIGHLPHQVIDL